MIKLELPTIQSQARQEIISILVYDGKIAAIKLYMKHVKCRLSDARLAVDRIAEEIEPGQASC